jgi:hypothetical protein
MKIFILARIRGLLRISLDKLREYAAAKFCFVPVLFAALPDHHSNMGPAEIPAKCRYTIQDRPRQQSFLVAALMP